MKTLNLPPSDKKTQLSLALLWAFITIFYNIAEGFLSIYFGITDETLALSGFGVDSFVEVISGLGILHMLLRMRSQKILNRDHFEKTALWITGIAFFLLCFGLIAGSLFNLLYEVKPETTLPGIIIAGVSILTMWFLYRAKLSTGKKLDSQALISDAKCTLTCFYLSFILLASSLLFHFFKVGYLDLLGSLGIAWFAYSEGKEAIEKAKSGSFTCSCNGGCSK